MVLYMYLKRISQMFETWFLMFPSFLVLIVRFLLCRGCTFQAEGPTSALVLSLHFTIIVLFVAVILELSFRHIFCILFLSYFLLRSFVCTCSMLNYKMIQLRLVMLLQASVTNFLSSCLRLSLLRSHSWPLVSLLDNITRLQGCAKAKVLIELNRERTLSMLNMLKVPRY